MKRITVLSSFPPIKGISAYTVGLIQELDKHCQIEFLGFRNIYPEFLYPNGTKDNNTQKPQLTNTHLRNHIDWYNPLTWIQAGYKVKGDILHIQWWSRILAPIYITILVIAKYIKHKQIFITVHNVLPHEKSFIKKRMNLSVFRLGDKFIVHSQENKKQLSKLVKKDIEVIPHGIIIPRISKNPPNQAREYYKISNNEKVLLFFGNIRDYKGLSIMLEALHILIQKDQLYKLIIAGPCREDWKKYQTIIDNYRLGSYIIRREGFISEDELSVLFGSSDLLVLPYKYFDAQSGVLALNFAFEVPALVSNLGGLIEMIDDKDLIFKAENIDDLIKKIKMLFVGNKLQEKRKYMKERKKMFEWENIVKKLLNFYNLK